MTTAQAKPDVTAVAEQLATQIRSGKVDRSSRKVSSLMTALGRKNVDRELLTLLEAALSRLGVHCVPSLQDAGLGRDSRVTLTLQQPTGQLEVGREAHIVRIAEGLVGKPGPFLNFKKPRIERGPAEVTLRSGKRIDLLLRSVRDGKADEWVAFEFKKHGGGLAVVEQLIGYLDDLEADGRKPLRGVIVANDTPEIRMADTPAGRYKWPIEWWVFQPEFKPVGKW